MYNGLILGLMILGILLALGFVVTLLINVFSAPLIMTPTKVVKEIVDNMNLEKDDTLFELGAGTGRISFEAASRGVNVKMYEIAPIPIIWARLVQISKKFTRKSKGSVELELESMYKAKLLSSSSVYLYLNDKCLKKLTHKLALAMADGVFVFVYKHQLPDFKPAKTVVLLNGESLNVYSESSLTKKPQ